MKKVFRLYDSFEEQENAERERRAAMSVKERLEEFAAIQERAWGDAWTKTPIKRVATYETLSWADPS